MASLRPFQHLQLDFARYVRDPENVAPPAGIEPRRMAIYARLVYNNVESVLANVFGSLVDIVGPTVWQALVRDFLRCHNAASPYYSKLPDEFLQYLAEREPPAGEREGPAPRRKATGPPLPPFSLELCHYAWVKYALPMAPDMPGEAFDDEPIVVDDAVALSPLAWPLTYAFPVTDLGPSCQPSTPPERATFLIASRDRADEVHFMTSNAVTLKLLALIAQGRSPGQAFAAIAAELNTPLVRVQDAGVAILNRLHADDVVVRAEASEGA